MTDGAAVWDTETGLCLHTQTVQTRFEGTCTQHRPMNRKGVGRFRCAHKSDYYLSFLDSRILSQGYVNSKFAQYCSSHSPPLSPYSYCFTAQTCRLLHCPSYMSCAQRSQDLQGNDFWPVASATSRTQTITQPLSILSFPAPLTSHPYGYKTAQRVHQVPHPSHRDFGRAGSHFQDSTQSNVSSSTSRKTCANEEYTTATHYLREPAKAEHEAEAGMRSQDTALSTRKQIQERQEGEPITSKTGARVPPSR